MNWDIKQKDMQYLKSYQKKKEKNSTSSPPIFFLIFFNVKKIKRQENYKNMLWGKETISSPGMWGKIKPDLKERGLEIPR
jgi:hypothetical protein